jgi:ribosomal protein S1
VIAIEAGFAIVDVGYKMEGRVELKEFANPGEAQTKEIKDRWNQPSGQKIFDKGYRD